MDAGHVQARRGPYVAGEGTVRVLAEAAILGIDVTRLIRTRDPEERDLLLAMHNEGINVLDEILTTLARKITKEHADAENRGRKKGRRK